MHAVGTEYKVCVMVALFDSFSDAFLLGHAAAQPYYKVIVLLFVFLHLPQMTEYFLFSAFPDTACIEDDYTAIAFFINRHITHRFQDPGKLLAVTFIHLAAEGLDHVSMAFPGQNIFHIYSVVRFICHCFSHSMIISKFSPIFIPIEKEPSFGSLYMAEQWLLQFPSVLYYCISEFVETLLYLCQKTVCIVKCRSFYYACFSFSSFDYGGCPVL